MVPCFSKNEMGVHTAEISLILCQNYAMCHVCLWFMKKWLKICKNFNSQHWKSFFWLTYSLNKNFTKARPWGLRPCSKRVPKSTNLWTTPPIYELGRYSFILQVVIKSNGSFYLDGRPVVTENYLYQWAIHKSMKVWTIDVAHTFAFCLIF